jgi:hypothetical protein
LDELVAFLEVGRLRDQKGAVNRRRDGLKDGCVSLCRKVRQPNDLGAAEQRTCI